MKKTIEEIQNEIANIISDVAMINVSKGDKLDKECKIKALESLGKLQKDLEEYSSGRNKV